MLWACYVGSTTRRLSSARRSMSGAASPSRATAQEAELKGIRAEMPGVCVHPLAMFCKTCWRGSTKPSCVLSSCPDGETPGYPRFHGRNRYNCFTYPQFGNGAPSTTASWSCRRSAGLPCAGPAQLKGTPKTVTISREADGWYVCFSCADVPVPLARHRARDGHRPGAGGLRHAVGWRRYFHPGWYRKAERRLKTAQRRVSRRKKGSNRRRKAVNLLARAHLKVKRQRQDFHHKRRSARSGQRHDLSRGFADGQHGQAPPPRQVDRRRRLVPILEHPAAKAAYAGRRVVAVPPAYTSQTCSGCGVMVTRACPSAGIPARTAERACIGTTTPPRI